YRANKRSLAIVSPSCKSTGIYGLLSDETFATKRESSYLLDATNPNRLWFHQFRERNWLSLNGLLRQSIEQFAAWRRGAAVEAECELVEIIVQVLGRHCALV